MSTYSQLGFARHIDQATGILADFAGLVEETVCRQIKWFH